jgi:hypothetical protein
MLARRHADEDRMKKGNLIASSVIALWGTAILLNALLRDDAVRGDGAFGAGQVAALVLAVVMVAAGVRGIRIELQRRAGVR